MAPLLPGTQHREDCQAAIRPLLAAQKATRTRSQYRVLINAHSGLKCRAASLHCCHEHKSKQADQSTCTRVLESAFCTASLGLTMPFNPISAAEACIRRSRRLLALSEQDLPDAKVKNDLRRSALVMVVTGIDSYMHWLVYRQISNLRNEGDLPKSLAKLDIPFTEIAALADSVIHARAQGVDSRPWVRVKHAMQKQLLKETFQSYDQVGNAFAWAGIEKGWSRVATELGEPTTTIKDRLNA